MEPYRQYYTDITAIFKQFYDNSLRKMKTELLNIGPKIIQDSFKG